MPIIHKDNRVKLQTTIDQTLHRRFKASCFLQGKGMNEVLTDLIAYWLETDKGGFPPERRKKRDQ
ncbi:plasmid partition protein ParG [Salmonella enterica]